MTYEQFKEIILMIDAYYPSQFKLADYQMKFWQDKLKDYDVEDIKLRFKQHISGEYANTPPKLAYLMKGLNTIEQKQKNGQWYIECPYCHKKFRFPQENKEQDKCFGRCMSIDYVTRMCKKFAINPKDFFKTNAKLMPDGEFQKCYVNFVKEVLKNKSGLTFGEINALNNIIIHSNQDLTQLILADSR